MTINELKERLDAFDGDTPILVTIGQDKNNLSIVFNIASVVEASNSLGFHKEAWLKIEK